MSKNSSSLHLFAGATSGFFACALLQPLDLLKTRMQQQQQIYTDSSISNNRTILGTVKQILIKDGIAGLWRGTTPTIFRNVPGNGLYFMMLNHWREFYSNAIPKLSGRPESSKSTVNLLSGASARSFTGFLAMPITIIKVRYESDMYQYKSIQEAIVSTSRSHGLRGFYAGYGATVMRDAPLAGIYVAAYEQFKTSLNALDSKRSFNIPVQLINGISGIFAGITATTLTHPFDVLKTRMQLQPEEYRNSVQSVIKILQEENVTGLFKGLVVRLMRKPLSSAITWVVYEEFLRLTNHRTNQMAS
ncbi:solute carrier family 25 member 38 [Basidiobolus meristosporus CBS 931.73]|uniref:Mitochondrial glycine transporter n=1 Tax=Basidiobolus meristosporus CBS 931.73 TaxID=1314790 RepID=A0A1Y1YWM7_9FUNG|nr:solute carrier family 25 member 38 [Basidiobolus meristosporus CBS 931.73]|eukprot:ORY02097.1 solute carrier family 25 member 38 [Basidiobolus meristosporus CBS 931.73]